MWKRPGPRGPGRSRQVMRLSRAARRERAHGRAKDPLRVARTSLDTLEAYLGELEDENRRLREQLENLGR